MGAWKGSASTLGDGLGGPTPPTNVCGWGRVCHVLDFLRVGGVFGFKAKVWPMGVAKSL